mmetsp:Transcript_6551/g.19445  ORF Transcript_6551/g.19445 Transcript_6551/m.19445 type:complete len:289 (+) Transcript_6551:113-979(+)
MSATEPWSASTRQLPSESVEVTVPTRASRLSSICSALSTCRSARSARASDSALRASKCLARASAAASASFMSFARSRCAARSAASFSSRPRTPQSTPHIGGAANSAPGDARAASSWGSSSTGISSPGSSSPCSSEVTALQQSCVLDCEGSRSSAPALSALVGSTSLSRKPMCRLTWTMSRSSFMVMTSVLMQSDRWSCMLSCSGWSPDKSLRRSEAMREMCLPSRMPSASSTANISLRMPLSLRVLTGPTSPPSSPKRNLKVPDGMHCLAIVTFSCSDMSKRVALAWR